MVVENPGASHSSTATAESKPSATETKRSWGDEADDEAEEQSAAPPTSADKAAEEQDVDFLTIDDGEKINKFHDEPENSNMGAVASGDTPYTSANTFEDLKLSAELQKGLHDEMKFRKPSPIQAKILPMILSPPYKNLIVQACNCSGKTTCFVLGMLSRVDSNLKAPQALCICPTRELAIQNMELLEKMGKYTGLLAEAAVPMDTTNTLLVSKRVVTAHIVIGTPPTIKKWMSAKKLGASYIKILVFDEADHMLAQDGFQDDSWRITKEIQRVNASCQVLLFSATFNDTVKNFVPKIVKDYNPLFVTKEELSLVSVKQFKEHWPDELTKDSVNRDRIIELAEDPVQMKTLDRTRRARNLPETCGNFGFKNTTIQGAHKQEGAHISTDLLARGSDQQQVLISDIVSDKLKGIVTKTGKDYSQPIVKKEELSLESVKHYKVHCPDELAKVSVIRDRIFELGENLGQAIIFVRARHSARNLHESLVSFGYAVTTIQGALKQEDRDRIVKEFRDGLTQVLISTDLARGFDQEQFNLVINYDLPVEHDSKKPNTPPEPDYAVYLAGHFGRQGAVFNLLCGERDMALMAKIENYFASIVITEVTPWNSEEEFKKALQAAGLL